MNTIKSFIGGRLAALLLVPGVYALLFVSGAGSGVIPPIPDIESEPEGLSALNLEINWPVFFAVLIGTTVFSLLILSILTFLRPRLGPEHRAPIEPDQFEQEFQELLHRISRDTDPSRSIRLLFDAAETRITHLPQRVQPETPLEWAERVTRLQPHLSEPLVELCNIYAGARYAPDEITFHDRDVAVQSLRRLKYLSENLVILAPPKPALPWT